MIEYEQFIEVEKESRYFLGITDYIKKRYRQFLRLRKPKEREWGEWSGDRGLAEFDDVAQVVATPLNGHKPIIKLNKIGSFNDIQSRSMVDGVGGSATKEGISLNLFTEAESNLLSRVQFWHESGHFLVFQDSSWKSLPIYDFSHNSDVDQLVNKLRTDGPREFSKKVLFEMCLSEAMADWTSLEVLKKKLDKYRYPNEQLYIMARDYLKQLGIIDALSSTSDERTLVGQKSIENVWNNIRGRIYSVYDAISKEVPDENGGFNNKNEHKIILIYVIKDLISYKNSEELMYLAHQFSLMKIIELSEKLETKELPKILEYLMNNPEYLFDGLDFDKLK